MCLLTTAGILGACVKYANKSQNLGVIQISPQAATDGSLTILYLSGDICKDKQQYSTRIIFQCDQAMVSSCVAVFFQTWQL